MSGLTKPKTNTSGLSQFSRAEFYSRLFCVVHYDAPANMRKNIEKLFAPFINQPSTFDIHNIDECKYYVNMCDQSEANIAAAREALIRKKNKYGFLIETYTHDGIIPCSLPMRYYERIVPDADS